MKNWIVGLIVILAILWPIYIVLDINNNFHNTILEDRRIQAIDIVSHTIHNMDQSKHIGHHHTKDGQIHLIHKAEDITLELNDPRFHNIFISSISDLRLKCATIIDLNGNVIFSTDPNKQNFKNNSIYHKVIQKKDAIPVMNHKDPLLNYESVKAYIPILFRSGEQVEIMGVIEIIFDITLLDKAITMFTLKSFLILIGPLFIISLMFYYSFERRKNVTSLNRKLNIINTIRNVQTRFIKKKESIINFDGILKELLVLTNSEYGFIGEVNDDVVIPISITDISWNKESGNIWKKHLTGELEFTDLDNLFGSVITTGNWVISNDPSRDSRAKRLHGGHPPLNSFMGIPLYSNAKIVGIIGVANKPEGYSEIDVETLSLLSETCALMIESNNSERVKNKLIGDLTESEEKFRLVTQSTHDAIMGVDEDGNISFWNNGARNMFGYTEEEIKGSTFLSLLPEEYINGYTHACDEAIKVENSFFVIDEKDIELYGRRKNGEEFPMQVTLTIWPFKEKKIYSAIIKDITERKKFENRLLYQANYDKLTSLPNRNMIDDRLHQAELSARRSESKVSVLFVDLDRFKYVNDTYGHDAGDDLLKQASRRLESCVREVDTVARLGGDEFLIILSDVKEPISVKKIANKVLTQLGTPFKLQGISQEVTISGSVGVSFYPDDGISKDELMKKADAAMYLAKQNGKNNYKFYTSDLDDENSTKLKIEKELRNALKNNEFSLNYQPIICMNDKTIVGAEALLRWDNPTLGRVSPAVFIPIVEEIGLMPTLGNWIFMTSCKEVGSIRNDESNLYLSINASVAQIENLEFTEIVSKIIEDTEFPPELIQLEITESMIMKNVGRTITVLSNLSQMGITIAIDDFGTGHSSLSNLKKIKANTLKIDKSFIDNVPQDQEEVAIVKAIIKMAQSLNLKIIAEGIEEEKQAKFLKKLNCDRGQGYLFYKPMPIGDLDKIINKKKDE